MKSFVYACKLALINIKRFRMITFIRLIGFYICMLIITVILTVYFGSVQYINGSLKFNNIDDLNLYVANSPQEELEFNSENHFEFPAVQQRVICNKKYLSGIGFSLIDEKFNEVYQDFISDGNMINNLQTDCIIGKNLSIKYNIKIGDEITISDQDFCVVGVTEIPRFTTQILLSDNDIVQTHFPKFYFFENNYNFNLDENNLYQNKNIYLYFRKFLDKESVFSILFMIIIILLYSMLSIINIHKFYFEKMNIAHQLQFAVGAKKSIVFFQNFFECLLITNFSNILAYISIYKLLKTFIKIVFINLYLPIYSLFILFLISLVISSVYALIISKRGVNL